MYFICDVVTWISSGINTQYEQGWVFSHLNLLLLQCPLFWLCTTLLLFSNFFFLFFFAFQGHICGIWKFPGQGSNQSCSFWPTPQPQQCQIQVTSATYITAHSNTGSLTHRAKPGIEPASMDSFLLRHNGNSSQLLLPLQTLIIYIQNLPSRSVSPLKYLCHSSVSIPSAPFLVQAFIIFFCSASLLTCLHVSNHFPFQSILNLLYNYSCPAQELQNSSSLIPD